MSDNIIQLNEQLIKTELKDLVRSSVEETLNALLDKEADELVNAEKYERSGERQGYRSGHYTRNLTTTAGDVKLNVPKLKGIPFETAIIERYRRRECSVEEALIEMYFRFIFTNTAIPERKWCMTTRYTQSFIMNQTMR
jgi:putative transposase